MTRCHEVRDSPNIHRTSDAVASNELELGGAKPAADHQREEPEDDEHERDDLSDSELRSPALPDPVHDRHLDNPGAHVLAPERRLDLKSEPVCGRPSDDLCKNRPAIHP